MSFAGARPTVLSLTFYLLIMESASCLAATAPTEHATRQPAIGTDTLQLEEKKLELDRERLNFEQTTHRDEMAAKEREIEVEKRNTLGIAGSVIAALVGLWVGVLQRQKDEKMNFQLKAAELAMDAQDAYQVGQRAKLLQSMFEGNLPENWAEQLNIEAGWFGEGRHQLMELLQLLSEHPESGERIMRIWGDLWPGDKKKEWFKNVSKHDTL